MAQRVRIGRVQDRAGIGVDHDRRISRAVAAPRIPSARIGVFARKRDQSADRDQREKAPTKPAWGSATHPRHADFPPSSIPRKCPPRAPHPCVLMLLRAKEEGQKRRFSDGRCSFDGANPTGYHSFTEKRPGRTGPTVTTNSTSQEN